MKRTRVQDPEHGVRWSGVSERAECPRSPQDPQATAALQLKGKTVEVSLEDWQEITDALQRTGVPWPHAAVKLDLTFLHIHVKEGIRTRLLGRPSLMQRWHWSELRVRRVIERFQAEIDETAAHLPQSMETTRAETDPAEIQEASSRDPAARPVTARNLRRRGLERSSDSPIGIQVTSRTLPGHPTSIQPRSSKDPVIADVSIRNPNEGESNASSGHPASIQSGSGGQVEGLNGHFQPRAPEAGAIQNRSSGHPAPASRSADFSELLSVSRSSGHPAGILRAVSRADPFLLTTDLEDQDASLIRSVSKKSMSNSAPPPSAEAVAFERVIRRWSDPAAIKAAAGGEHVPAPWKVQRELDMAWFTQQFMAMPEAESVNMVAMLEDWDNHLETVVRSGERGKYKFPTNWKTALQKQLKSWFRFGSKQGRGESDEQDQLRATAGAGHRRAESPTGRQWNVKTEPGGEWPGETNGSR